jgi:hypothetical protein
MIDISAVSYDVKVDWDMTDWSAEPDFGQAEDDISQDVQSVDIARGKDTESGNAPAATLEIRLKPGLCLKYSPVNSDGPLYGRLLPWRAINVMTIYSGSGYQLYAGFISKISINPHEDIQSVTLYCTDGMDLLARQLLTEDHDNKSAMTEGDAVSIILDAAGWGGRRSIDTGGSVIYPGVSEY